MPKRNYRIRSFLIIQHVHDGLCKHLGIDYTDPDDRYSIGTRIYS